MKKNTKRLFGVAAIVFLLTLGWWWLSSPKIEVKMLNLSPKQAQDYNVALLPAEKQNKIYPYIVVVKDIFKGKEYVTAYPEDAVTVTGSGMETRAHIYTNDPDTKRLTKYIK